jgi:hypothetical protein
MCATQVTPAPGTSGPEWVVLDGPLTSIAAEVLLPLIVGNRGKPSGAFTDPRACVF